MSKSYAAILQRLCQDYSNHHMSFEEYRTRRQSLLEKVDEQFNGKKERDAEELTSPGIPSAEFGIPSMSQVFGKKHHS